MSRANTQMVPQMKTGFSKSTSYPNGLHSRKPAKNSYKMEDVRDREPVIIDKSIFVKIPVGAGKVTATKVQSMTEKESNKIKDTPITTEKTADVIKPNDITQQGTQMKTNVSEVRENGNNITTTYHWNKAPNLNGTSINQSIQTGVLRKKSEYQETKTEDRDRLTIVGNASTKDQNNDNGRPSKDQMEIIPKDETGGTTENVTSARKTYTITNDRATAGFSRSTNNHTIVSKGKIHGQSGTSTISESTKNNSKAVKTKDPSTNDRGTPEHDTAKGDQEGKPNKQTTTTIGDYGAAKEGTSTMDQRQPTKNNSTAVAKDISTRDRSTPEHDIGDQERQSNNYTAATKDDNGVEREVQGTSAMDRGQPTKNNSIVTKDMSTNDRGTQDHNTATDYEGNNHTTTTTTTTRTPTIRTATKGDDYDNAVRNIKVH